MKTSVKIVIAFIVVILLTILSYNLKTLSEIKKILSNLPKSEMGVWGNENFELVRTQNMAMIFRKESDDRTSTCLIKFRPYTADSVKAELICRIVLDKEKVVSKQMLTNLDSAISKLYVGELQDHKIQLRYYPLKRCERLDLVEQIESSEKPNFFTANSNNIGDCLQQWKLGSKFKTEGDNVHAMVETNKHSFIFAVNPEIIYCRAARIRSNNNGICFAQNIRLMNNKNEHTAYFADNNFELINSNLVMDDTKFDTSKCVFAEEGIYWSLTNFSKNEILLNGCGGETYRYSPSDNHLEFFKYEKY